MFAGSLLDIGTGVAFGVAGIGSCAVAGTGTAVDGDGVAEAIGTAIVDEDGVSKTTGVEGAASAIVGVEHCAVEVGGIKGF